MMPRLELIALLTDIAARVGQEGVRLVLPPPVDTTVEQELIQAVLAQSRQGERQPRNRKERRDAERCRGDFRLRYGERW